MTQDQALSIMKTGVNVYLTGSAGSGKTYLLNQYVKYLRDHDITYACTASTGIAATHMNGQTIHGWSGIGIKEFLDERDMENLESKQYLWKRFEKARVLIIDEVSMLHAHRLDMVEKVCRRFKRNEKPFGGLQVILCGDFFQLPPINKSNNPDIKDMIIHSNAWRIMNPAICYLSEQHRQDDEILTDILNAIRDDMIDDYHFEHLESRMGAILSDSKPTMLYTHNVNVDVENNTELANIDSEEKIFKMTSTGHDVLVDILKKSCLAHEELRLKIGAEVIFIKNNFEEGYVNGTKGKVIDIIDANDFDTQRYTPVVRIHSSGKVIHVTPESWAIEEDGKVKASISQIPLRLAWAITIHKSQGMSLDVASIDLSRTFSYGMGYVALSRVRTLSGIKLTGFNRNALQVDPKVLIFDKDLKEKSRDNEEMFGKLKKDEQKKLEEDFIVRMGGRVFADGKNPARNSRSRKVLTQKENTLDITLRLLKEKKSIKEISKERDLTAGTITHHIEQIMSLYPETDISYLRPKEKNIELVRNANTILEDEQVGKLSPIKSILEKGGHELTFEDIRLARLFI